MWDNNNNDISILLDIYFKNGFPKDLENDGITRLIRKRLIYSNKEFERRISSSAFNDDLSIVNAMGNIAPLSATYYSENINEIYMNFLYKKSLPEKLQRYESGNWLKLED